MPSAPAPTESPQCGMQAPPRRRYGSPQRASPSRASSPILGMPSKPRDYQSPRQVPPMHYNPPRHTGESPHSHPPAQFPPESTSGNSSSRHGSSTRGPTPKAPRQSAGAFPKDATHPAVPPGSPKMEGMPRWTTERAPAPRERENSSPAPNPWISGTGGVRRKGKAPAKPGGDSAIPAKRVKPRHGPPRRQSTMPNHGSALPEEGHSPR